MKADVLIDQEDTEIINLGTCRFCGQVFDAALEVCNCPDARREEKIAELVGETRERVDQLFGESAEELGFKPLPENGSIELIENVAELIARRVISSATIQIWGACKAKLNLTTKGKIKVARIETRSYDLESGE